jgi:hypothetical protein
MRKLGGGQTQFNPGEVALILELAKCSLDTHPGKNWV